MPQKQPAEELLLDTAALRHATHTAWPPPPHQLPSFPEIRKSHYAVATLYIYLLLRMQKQLVSLIWINF